MNFGQNAMTEIFEEVTVLGQPMIFTNLWIDRSTVPKGLYLYEVQHDSDRRGERTRSIAPLMKSRQ